MQRPWLIRAVVVSVIAVAISAFSPIRVLSQDTTHAVLRLKQVGKKALANINTLVVCDSTFIAMSYDDVYVSRDQGMSWTELATQLPNKTVLDVITQDDTLFALTVNGTVYTTRNHGLSWDPFQKYRTSPLPNTVRASSGGIIADHVEKSHHTAEFEGSTYSVVDTSIVVETPFGTRCTISTQDLTQASCITVSNNAIYVGCRRQGVLAFSQSSLSPSWIPMGPCTNEYVNTLVAYNGYLYVGVVSGLGGVYRKAEIGTGWDVINIDRAMEPVDVLCLKASPRGIYVGTRTMGLMYLAHGGYVAYPIHNGLHDAVNQSIDEFGPDLLITSRLRGISRVRSCGEVLERYSSTLPMSGEYIACPIGNTVIVGLTEGILLRSRLGGGEWDTLSLRLAPSTINRIRQIDGKVYVCTNEGAYVSADTGNTWSDYNRNLKSVPFYNITAIPDGWLVLSSENAYLVNQKGEVDIFAPNGRYQFAPRINDAVVHDGVIYAVGFPGVCVSRDSGRTWECFYIDDMLVATTMTISGSKFYVFGIHGRLYEGTLPIRQ